MLAVPFFLGNKGCDEGTTWEHPDVARDSDCSECHEGGMTKDTKPAWHDLTFKHEHGALVQRFRFDTKNSCNLCHTQSSCSECHQITPPANHNQFFRLRGHALQVGFDRSQCMTCHRTDFCQRCHMETKPIDHMAGFGASQNRHCLNCHYPLESYGAQRCVVCHQTSSAHMATPRRPSNVNHLPNADCRGCHTPLRHPDNGQACIICHTQ
ncbi:MAG TPA: hypothetical protein VI895_01555 [Bdellovibrionota bacterium]|nr:hypothetical protein [Bdellovibrionota bacterium]